MLKASSPASQRASWILLAIIISVSRGQVATTLPSVDAPYSSPSPLTCPSRSVNYITQTLPQQCFTTSWASKSATREETVASETHGVHGSSEPLLTITTPTPTLDAVISLGTRTVSSAASGQAETITSSQESATTVTTTQLLAETGTSTLLPPDTETESPLDNANFLSFEEWKKQNLAKAGQSAENLGSRTRGNEHRRRPAGINNALDSLGEDTELEIDFAGFVSPGDTVPASPAPEPRLQQETPAETEERKTDVVVEDSQGPRKRSKDAGKTCKERFNYASLDCAATVLKTNPESKESTAVLVENKDSYLLNMCSAKNKFLIVELCEDILIDTVVLANYEFFSSMFRTFKISVSDKYPVKPDKWKLLGTFEGRNSRDIQAFLVENPLIWARYLRVEFLTHFGNEYYCPVSLLRVHGTTMMEEFNHDLKRIGTEEEGELDVAEAGEEEGSNSEGEVIASETSKEQKKESSIEIEDEASPVKFEQSDPTITTHSRQSELVQTSNSAKHNSSSSTRLQDSMLVLFGPDNICRPEDEPADYRMEASHAQKPAHAVSSAVASTTDSTTSDVTKSTNSTSMLYSTKETAATPSVHSLKPSTLNQTSASTAKIQTSSTQPASPNPTTQESFFKSVHKRLQLLESNSTLSLQYIEEQSRILRDAFSKVEKRQLGKTTNFLENLNTTVLTELREFRMQYDQIWQSTVLELSSQRQSSQNEVFALSARLSLLADEMVFQKRIAILQFILILICLGLALFARSGSSSAYLELPPLMQNAIGKSSISLARPGMHHDASSFSPSSTRLSSRYGLLRGWAHRSSPSYDSQVGAYSEGMKSPDIEYSPPTPTSQDSPEDRHPNDGKANDTDESSDEPRRPDLRQTRSPVPNADGSADDLDVESGTASES